MRLQKWMNLVLAFVLLGLATACGPQPNNAVSTALPAPAVTMSTPTAAPVATAAATAIPAAATGTIAGRAHLAGPPTPPLVIYVVDQNSPAWFSQETQQAEGEALFSLKVPAGTYVVFAAVAGQAGVGLGYFDESGKKLGTVTVTAGETTDAIAVTPPSQNECGSMAALPASPDGHFGATASPCIATAEAATTPAAVSAQVLPVQVPVGFPVSKIVLGLICGIAFGAVSVATMLPLKFEDKRAAMAGAFANRFAIGFVIGATNLPWPGWASGLVFGLLLSLPDAIITKAWIPLMVIGGLGGLICGLVIGALGV